MVHPDIQHLDKKKSIGLQQEITECFFHPWGTFVMKIWISELPKAGIPSKVFFTLATWGSFEVREPQAEVYA